MTLAVRIVARLDIKSPSLIKMRRYEGVRVVGNPRDYASIDADEIVYMDVVASLNGFNSLDWLVEHTTAETFVPVTVGGGVRSVDDARRLFNAGADKIALNTAAIERPSLIDELAHKYGSQAVVIQVDASGTGEAWCDGGRQPTGKKATEWAREAVDRGAGEVLLTSIDREGMGAGYGLDLIHEVSWLSVPVMASGGYGRPEHMVEAVRAGASAVAAHVTHLGDLVGIRRAMADAGFPVRGVRHEQIRASVPAGCGVDRHELQLDAGQRVGSVCH